MKYEPFLVSPHDASVEVFLSGEYRAFLQESVFKPSLELILDRHRRRPDYPYIDTKFNPNTGKEMPPEKYEMVYTWILGRGAEALQAHVGLVGALFGEEAGEAETVLQGMLAAMRDAIRRIVEKNDGICPHVVDRDFAPVEEEGKSVEPRVYTFGNIFCAKGMVASPREEDARFGYLMLRDVVDAIREGRHEGIKPGKRSHGFAMITVGGLLSLVRRRLDDESVRFAMEAASCLLSDILNRHYDTEEGKFFEFVSDGGEPLRLVDPGHAAELVAFALGIVDEGERVGWDFGGLDEMIRNAAPRILDFAFRSGWNDVHEGVYKLVDTDTGEPVIDDMPWWNLPEMMRAAAWMAKFDPERESLWMQIAARCNNAYFAHYPAPDNRLFPVQTRSGKTGEVIDVPPALPEGDPLYHANLTFMDMLEVMERSREV